MAGLARWVARVAIDPKLTCVGRSLHWDAAAPLRFAGRKLRCGEHAQGKLTFADMRRNS